MFYKNCQDPGSALVLNGVIMLTWLLIIKQWDIQMSLNAVFVAYKQIFYIK